MIIVKVINQRVVQVAFAAQQPSGHILSGVLATKNKKQLALAVRTLYQSTSHNQKVSSLENVKDYY